MGPIPQYHLNDKTGTPDFITFGEPFGLVLPEAASADPTAVALALFERYPLLFGTGDVPSQLQVRQVLIDPGPNPMRHIVLQQVYAGVLVFGAELRVHLSPTLGVRSVSGVYVRIRLSAWKGTYLAILLARPRFGPWWPCAEAGIGRDPSVCSDWRTGGL